MIDENINIQWIPETKLDHSFLSAQFLTNDYRKLYCLNVSVRGGGLFVDVFTFATVNLGSKYLIIFKSYAYVLK